jgi:hypothetical protein
MLSQNQRLKASLDQASTHLDEVMRFSRFKGGCVDLTRTKHQLVTLSPHVYLYCQPTSKIVTYSIISIEVLESIKTS